MMMMHFDRVFCCLSTETWLSFSRLFFCCFYQHCVFSHKLNCPFTHRPGSGPGFRLLHPVTGPHGTRAVRVQQPELVKPILLPCRRHRCPRWAWGTFFEKIMELSLLIFSLETYRFCMKCIEFTTCTYNFKNLAVGSLIWSSKTGMWG